MTFGEALVLAAVGVFLIALLLGFIFWTMNAWMDGDWPERALNLVAWIGAIAFIIWRLNRPGGPM